MIRYLPRIVFVTVFYVVLAGTIPALDVYMGSLGHDNLNAASIAEIPGLSNSLQQQLMRISNNEITYLPLYTDKELAADYDNTIIESKIGAIAACIFNNIETVLYGTAYIDPKTRYCVTQIRIYDKTSNKNIVDINYSQILFSGATNNYAQDLSIQINETLYEYVTGNKYQVPFATLAPIITASPAPSPSPTPAPEVIQGATSTSPSAITDDVDTLRTDLKKIVDMLSSFNFKLDEIEEKSIPAATQEPAPTPEPVITDQSKSTPAPGATAKPETTPQPTKTIKARQWEEYLQPLKPTPKPVKPEKQYLSFNAGAGYFFTFSGKWQYPVVPIFTVEEGMKLRMYLVDMTAFKLLLRQSTSFNYSFLKENPDNEYNRYIHLHAMKARLGIDFYFELGRIFGFYLGGGGQFSYNAVDFRTILHTFYADTHYALGAYGNAGFEFLFGNVGLGCDNIFDMTFFDKMIMDYRIMLMLTFKF